MKKTIVLGLILLFLACEKDHSPLKPAGHQTGVIKIVIEDKAKAEKIYPDSTNTKLKAAKSARLDQLEIRVLKIDNSVMVSKNFTLSNGFFNVSITVEARSNLKVLCIGTFAGVAGYFGIDEDVDVEAGKTTTAVIAGWNDPYLSEIGKIIPNPSTDGSYTVSWTQAPNATIYILQEADNDNFAGAATVYSGSDLKKSFSGKTSGTYYYQVQASNIYNVTSSWSDNVSVIVKEIPDITFVPIPAGSFMMGSNDGYGSEKPVHGVSLDGFEMSVTEITQEQYEAVTGLNPSYFTGEDNLPVGNVSWEDAIKFCNMLSDEEGFDRCYNESTWECNFSANGYRLPTEAEWEYACRAGTTTKYYTGDSESDLSAAGWYDATGTRTVGQKAPNLWGLYDMHGNAAELCNDWYDSEYYSTSPGNNPTGPQTGSYRVIRGGSVFKLANGCRAASRDSYSYFMSNIVGFRVVRGSFTPHYTISGIVSGADGVKVTLSGDKTGSQVVTTEGGSYSFTVAKGGSYTLTPSKDGYTFTPSNQTFNNLTADQTQDFTATEIQTQQYSLTMAVNQVGWGTTTPSVGTHTYDENTVVSITAAPAEGYRFVIWTGDVVDTGSSSTTVTMTGDKTVTANFEEIPPVELDITFVSIPGGTFDMGSNFEDDPDNPYKGKGYYDNEKPVHTVTLSSFEMSAYEITNAQYASYLTEALASGDITASSSTLTGKNGDYSGDEYLDLDDSSCEISYSSGTFTVDIGKENQPVIEVSWYGAKAFALYYGLDLPTEAEWEYACRAGTETKFYTGNNLRSEGSTSTDLDRAGWYYGNANDWTHPVGQKEPNAWGLYDMHGNVWEWCSDWYGSEYYSSSPLSNPHGPSSGSLRVLRGGSWQYYAWGCRSASRGWFYPSNLHNYLGFRIVRRP